MSDESQYVVRIERIFEADIYAVFEAWTNPEVMKRWFHCGVGWTTPEAEVDLRLGGTVRIVMRRHDGSETSAHGRFTAIDRPHRLAMTWTFDDEPDNEQRVELVFSEAEGSTHVQLINSRISREERRDSQAAGWYACLEELARLLLA